MKKCLTKLLAVILCISLINIPVFPVTADVDLIVVEEDFTKYSSLNDIPNFVYTENEHTAISVVNGTGLVLEQVKSTPTMTKIVDGVETLTYNTGKSAAIGHIIEGVFNVNEEKRTSYRINRYAGNYKITMDFEMICDAYEDKVDGVSINKPYYEFNFTGTSSASKLTTTGKKVHLRMYGPSTVLYDPSANLGTMKYEGTEHQMVLDIDTEAKYVTLNIDGKAKAVAGNIQSGGYINTFNLASMERMIEGSKFVIKKIKIEQTGRDDATTAALTALESIPDPTATPYAVTKDLNLAEISSVTWTTSDKNVIDATGKVTRGEVGTPDKEVTLTATYKSGDMIIYKDFDFTVKSYSASEMAAMAVDAIDLNLGSEVTEDITLPLTAENGTTFTWSSNNTDVITNDGKVTQAKKDTTVTLTVTGTYGDQTATRTFDVFVPGTGAPDEPIEGGIAVEEDFTKYSSLADIPNFIYTENEHTTVSVVNGTGIVLEQVKSTPLNADGSSYNTNKSSAIAHIIQGVFNKNDETRTSYRIDRFDGKYKITMDFDIDCEKYPDNKYNGIPMSNPYYELNVLGTASPENLAITDAKNSRFSLRMYGASTSLYDPSSNLGTPKYTDGEPHQMVIDIDTASRDISMNIDNYKAPVSGQIKKAGYINSFTLYSMERGIVGSKFVIKKIKIEQTEANAATEALEALEAIEPLAADPYAVKEDITIPSVENVTWSISDTDVISPDGKVTRTMDDEVVTITATYTKGDIILYKDYVLTVKGLTDDEIAEADVKAIELDIKDKVTKNIYLPEMGENGTIFTWTSSRPEVVSNTGRVVQADGEDVTVTLTVAGTYGDKTHTRTFTVFVPRKGVSGEFIPTVDKLIYVEEDFTNYSSINDIPYFIYDKATHATVEIIAGKGLAVTQTKSTPLTEGVDAEGNATFSVNKEQVPNIAHVIEGKFNADETNRTFYTINRYGGKYRMTVDYEVKLDKYTEPVNDITVSNPYYPFYFGKTPEPAALTSTITNNFVYYTRVTATSLSNYATTSSGAFSNSIKYDEGGLHHMVVDFDTLTKSATVNVDNYKTPATGYFGKPGYINTFYLAGMERMKVGSYFLLKKITFQQLEEDEATTKALEALKALPETLAPNPFAVTEDIVLPTGNDKITWTTSDDTVITATGRVKRWYADRDVVLTATYTDYDTVIAKKYTLTVKELDEYKKTELVSNAGNALADFDQAGDLAKGSATVSENGITIVKKLNGTGNTTSDMPVYYTDYTMYRETVAYSEDTKASVSSAGYTGIYDISFNVTPSMTGDKPIYIALGGKDKTFTQLAALAVTKNSVAISYEKGTYKFIEENTTGKTYNVVFRVDTTQQRVWIYIDGALVGKYFDFTKCEMVDTLRIILDENNAQNDQVLINDIKLIEIVEGYLDIKQTLTNALKKLTFDVVTETPDNVTSVKELPTTVGGYRINWVSNSNLIDLDTGKVYHGLEGEFVTVSAIINAEGVYVKKNFRLYVRGAATGDEKIDYYLSDIAETITKQNAEDVRYDINLPSQHNGIAINWASSAPSILGADGKINKNATITEATEVTLTASIPMDGSTYTRTFTYKVSPRTAPTTIFASNDAPASLTINGVKNVAVAGTTVTDIKFNQTGNGNITLTDSNGKEIIVVNVSGPLYNITHGDGTTVDYPVSADKAVDLKVMIMPDIDKVAIWEGDKLIADSVKTLKAVSDIASISVVGGVQVVETTITADEYAMLDINLANSGYFDVFAKNVVKENVTFVNSTVVPADVLWESSDNSLINVTNGNVAKPDTYRFVDVTLTLTSNNDPSVKRVITKKVAVACADNKNLAKGAKATTNATPKTGYLIDNITDGKLNTAYGTAYANRTPVIKLDFGKETYFNTIYVNEDFAFYDKGLKSYTIAYSNDGDNWTTVKTGTITDAASNLIGFDTVYARYLSFTVNECETNSLYINEIEAYLYAEASELVKLDVEQIDLNLGYSVTSDIALPPNGQFGTTFAWESSNAGIISSTGKVTQPAEDTNVILTVTGNIGTHTYSKSFTVYVAGKSAIGATPVGGGAGGAGGGGAGGGVGASQLPGFVETDITPVEDVVVNTESDFGDMDSTHWAYENVNKLKELGIVNGDENGNFNPSGKVTREQFLKMLVVATNVDMAVENVKFADVDSSKWYAVYVAAGVNAGLVNGMTADTFGIGADIARQDMAVMIARILESKNITVTQTSEVFDDDNNVSSYAKNAVYLVRDAGIIQGYNNNFNPKDSLTRAEAATVIIKMLELLK